MLLVQHPIIVRLVLTGWLCMFCSVAASHTTFFNGNKFHRYIQGQQKISLSLATIWRFASLGVCCAVAIIYDACHKRYPLLYYCQIKRVLTMNIIPTQNRWIRIFHFLNHLVLGTKKLLMRFTLIKFWQIISKQSLGALPQLNKFFSKECLCRIIKWGLMY